jgi:hypothetical protein
MDRREDRRRGRGRSILRREQVIGRRQRRMIEFLIRMKEDLKTMTMTRTTTMTRIKSSRGRGGEGSKEEKKILSE